MPAPSIQIDLPKFIPQQSIYSLQLTPSERFRARDYLQLEKLPDLGTSRSDDPELQRSEEMAREYRNRWVEEPSRFALLADPSHRRVCITVSAGTGKSKALEQLVVLRQAFDPNHLVILVHFGQLPNDPNEFLSFLVEEYQRVLEDLPPLVTGNLSPVDSVLPYIQSLARSGTLTIAVDGLDEVNVVDGKKKAYALRRFLRRYPKCCCCVAGRPYAIAEFYWRELLSADEECDDDASSVWEFWLVVSFTSQQMRQYLGEGRYKDLLLLQADIEFTPRVLEAFRTLPREALSRVRSVADVFWNSVDKSLRLDRDKPSSTVDCGIEHAEVLDFLSACAITLAMWQHDPTSLGDRKSGRVVSGQEPVRQLSGLTKFRELVFGRMRRIYGTDWPVEKKWSALLRMNSSHVEFGFFSLPEPDSLYWRNATDRDFFAALWMVRSSDEAERDWFATRQSSVVASQFEAIRLPELNEVWWFICGMPSEAFIERDDGYDELGRWLQTIAPLYSTDLPYRATELMYRCWPNLLHRAGFLKTRSWNEYELLEATTHAQTFCDPKRLPDQAERTSVRLLAAPKVNALRLIVEFLGQYPALRDSESDAAKICHEDLEDHWCECESSAGMVVRVGHSDESDNVERLKTLPQKYSLCAYQVTSRLYRLFDGEREWRYGAYHIYSADRERGVAIFLNWYDSMMFCIWCHGYLPSEWELEHASRAGCRSSNGRNAIWHWGDDETLIEKHARTEGRRVDTVKFRKHRPNLKRLYVTLFKLWRWARGKTDGYDTIGQFTPNRYGLYDTIGDVWHWCRNRYAEEEDAVDNQANRKTDDFVHRVLRGGRLNGIGFLVRCSYRYLSAPSVTREHYGCRVSRIHRT